MSTTKVTRSVITSDAISDIPDTVTKLTLAELKTRQLAIHAKYPMRDHNEDKEMSNDEVEASVDAWWATVQ